MNRRDREIAVRAIAARATGKPEEAAAEILAGIAVLDGQHLPILLWSPGTDREEKAAWHRSEAAYWEESAARFAALTVPLQSAVCTHPESQGRRSIGERGQPLPDSASSKPGPHGADTESLHPDQCFANDRGANDVS